MNRNPPGPAYTEEVVGSSPIPPTFLPLYVGVYYGGAVEADLMNPPYKMGLLIDLNFTCKLLVIDLA